MPILYEPHQCMPPAGSHAPGTLFECPDCVALWRLAGPGHVWLRLGPVGRLLARRRLRIARRTQ